ncbi:MAG: transposase [Pseudomonadota bacterium]|nr:transposase [Pseudomonadota bacterium]
MTRAAAEVCCAAHQRKKLEHLCRYITRPAIANKRLKRNSAGDVVLQLKSPYYDGTTHIVMSPLEFMQRLAARVPRPRLHLIRFHGVLAPNAKHRSAIVASAPVSATNAAEVHPNTAHHSAPARINWARLLKRVFDIDIERCLRCGGTLKIIAAIEDPPVIAKIFSSRLVRPGPAPIPGAAIRPIPNGLIQNQHPRHSVKLPEPALSLVHPPKIQKCPQTWRLGPMNSPIIPRFRTEIARV